MKDNLQSELVSSLYKQEAIDHLLSESEHIGERRKVSGIDIGRTDKEIYPGSFVSKYAFSVMLSYYFKHVCYTC